MRTLAELKAAGRVRCPSCGARADAICRGDAGEPTEYHQARYVAGAAAPTPITAARKPARRQPATAQKPGSKRPAWLLVDDESDAPNAPRRELEVHFSERRRATVKVTIKRRAAEAIAGFATRRGGFTEEGGILMGRSFAGQLTIMEAAGPGQNSKRTATTYRPDVEHDLGFLADLKQWLATDDLRELGVWHTHSKGATNRPSNADLQHFANMYQLLGGTSYLGVILVPRANGFRASAWVTREGDPAARDPWYVCGPAAELIVEGKSWS